MCAKCTAVYFIYFCAQQHCQPKTPDWNWPNSEQIANKMFLVLWAEKEWLDSVFCMRHISDIVRMGLLWHLWNSFLRQKMYVVNLKGWVASNQGKDFWPKCSVKLRASRQLTSHIQLHSVWRGFSKMLNKLVKTSLIWWLMFDSLESLRKCSWSICGTAAEEFAKQPLQMCLDFLPARHPEVWNPFPWGWFPNNNGVFTLASIFLAKARNCNFFSRKCEYICKLSHKCHWLCVCEFSVEKYQIKQVLIFLLAPLCPFHTGVDFSHSEIFFSHISHKCEYTACSLFKCYQFCVCNLSVEKLEFQLVLNFSLREKYPQVWIGHHWGVLASRRREKKMLINVIWMQIHFCYWLMTLKNTYKCTFFVPRTCQAKTPCCCATSLRKDNKLPYSFNEEKHLHQGALKIESWIDKQHRGMFSDWQMRLTFVFGFCSEARTHKGTFKIFGSYRRGLRFSTWPA